MGFGGSGGSGGPFFGVFSHIFGVFLHKRLNRFMKEVTSENSILEDS